ncbi:MAG: hypothetical protein FWD67_11435 [Betaproteobacteria bacterium]|nr:hypothetical protein [Betaproteobacteria bacterium]
MRWRFVDKAVFFAPWKAIAIIKAGSLEEYKLLERWGENGLAPASLLLESCVQAARWLVEASSSFSLTCDLQEVGFWRATEGLRPGERYWAFLQVVERGDESLTLALRQKRLLPGEGPLDSDASYNGEADGRFSVSLTHLAARNLPHDRECLWQEIRHA